MEMSGGKIKSDRREHRPVSVTYHEPQHRRKQPHQDDIERKYIKVERLEFEDQSFCQRLNRKFHQARNVELVHQVGNIESMRQVVNCGEIEQKQQRVRHIQLPNALEQTCSCDHEAALSHHLSKHQGGR